MSEAPKDRCPTCGSEDPDKYYAFSIAFGGKWIPWWTCKDEWHSHEAHGELRWLL